MATSTRGILNPRAGEAHFDLRRFEPSRDLAELVDRFWVVRWELREAFEQETLPWPCVNVVIGTHRPGVHGVFQARFVAKLEGAGWVIGTKFRPGGFRGFTSFAIADLTDRTVSIERFFGAAGIELEHALKIAKNDRER